MTGGVFSGNTFNSAFNVTAPQSNTIISNNISLVTVSDAFGIGNCARGIISNNTTGFGIRLSGIISDTIVSNNIVSEQIRGDVVSGTFTNCTFEGNVGSNVIGSGILLFFVIFF